MFIQFGIFNKKYLAIFITPLISALKRLLVKKDENINQIYSVFINYLSLNFCGILYLISKFLTKPAKKNQKNNLPKIDEQNPSNNNEKNIEKIKSLRDQLMETYELEAITKMNEFKKRERNKNIIILILSGLQLAGEIIQKITKEHLIKEFKSSIPFLLEIFFFIIFSMIFLNYSLFIHHYTSLCIFFICYIIIFIQTIKYTNGITVIDSFKTFIYYYSYVKCYCLLDVLGKQYLNTFTDNIYIFLFKIGIIGLPPLLLYDIICNACGLDDKYHGIFETIFHHFDILKFLRDLLYSISVDIGFWLTINNLSPCHIVIIDIIKTFLEKYFDLITKKDDYVLNEQLITFSILYPILIFDILIFNEILILNFCGLNKNTRLYIMKREKIDINISSDSFDLSLIDENEKEDDNSPFDDDKKLY